MTTGRVTTRRMQMPPCAASMTFWDVCTIKRFFTVRKAAPISAADKTGSHRPDKGFGGAGRPRFRLAAKRIIQDGTEAVSRRVPRHAYVHVCMRERCANVCECSL